MTSSNQKDSHASGRSSGGMETKSSAAKTSIDVGAIAPPNAYNMGGSSSQKLDRGGVDTLAISLYGSFDEIDWKWVRPKLESCKQAAQNGEGSASIHTYEGDVLQVQSVGARHGVHCRWVLEWRGCRIAIVNSPEYSAKRLSVHVTIGSLLLMEVGHVKAWSMLLDVLRSLGYNHQSEIVGRVDICVDLPQTSMDEIEATVNEARLICRAKKSQRYENCYKLETYVRGSGPLLVRIYEKAIEVRNDPVKQALMIERRWGGRVADAVRVEFQLRNKALWRLFAVKTMAELFENLGTIAHWCTHDWFRMVETKFDRKNKNHSRAVTSELWEKVQAAFAAWTGEIKERVIPAKKRVPDFDLLKKQAVGCAAAIVAALDDGTSFIAAWMRMGKEFMVEGEARVADKRAELAALNRVISVGLAEMPF